MRPVVLSGRLQAVASMVSQGSLVCDVGCDHGYVSIYLVEHRISPHVLAMDVRKGPLAAASLHVAERGLGIWIETRLSDGLHNYSIGEADSLICAGMGGRLMMRILGEERQKTESFRELILQPQSEVEQFRTWLREQSYWITMEQIVEEEGKFYPMMRVEPRGRQGDCDRRKDPAWVGDLHVMLAQILQDETDESEMLWKLCDRYGGYLLAQRNCTLQAYLEREERVCGEILQRLQEQELSTDKNRRRYSEVEALLRENKIAQEIAGRLRERGGSYGYDQD